MSMPAQARPCTPIRLTRRGRIVVVIAIALILLVGLWVSARHGARATSGGERGPVTERESVTVGPSDTLWDIAVRARPEVDPRVTVQRMIDLNALSSAIVNPGQRVYIPSR
jgi:Tfp pilus assembly protein FimV